MRRKRYKKIQITKKEKIAFFLLSVLVVTFFLFQSFSKTISPRITHVAQVKFAKYIDQIASNYGVMNEFQIPFDNLLAITKNEKGEILTVDYHMSQIYTIAQLMTDHLMKSVETIESKELSEGKVKQEILSGYNAILMMLPIGAASNLVFLNNLGPKIPVLVRFIDSVYTNVKTRLTNYGINNCLVELYLEVSIKYELITPVASSEQRLDYSVLMHAKLIQGTVPSWYSGEMITKSNGVNSPILGS